MISSQRNTEAHSRVDDEGVGTQQGKLGIHPISFRRQVHHFRLRSDLV